MISDTQIRNQIFKQVQRISPDQLRELSEYLENLVQETKETEPTDLLQFVGLFDKGDLLKMQLAIEQGCEKIDHDEW